MVLYTCLGFLSHILLLLLISNHGSVHILRAAIPASYNHCKTDGRRGAHWVSGLIGLFESFHFYHRRNPKGSFLLASSLARKVALSHFSSKVRVCLVLTVIISTHRASHLRVGRDVALFSTAALVFSGFGTFRGGGGGGGGRGRMGGEGRL